MALVSIIDDEDKRYEYLVDSSLPPIGKGGMGTVFRGVRVDRDNPENKKDVAVKFIHEGESAILDRERRSANIVIHSDNVVEMMGFITMTVQTAKGMLERHFVVSELLNGVSLLNLVKGVTKDINGNDFEYAKMLFQRFRIDRRQFVIDVVGQVLKGLEDIHRAGYMHRDIDPSNIMITDKGQVKIIDFGIAKKFGSGADYAEAAMKGATQYGMGMGKVMYASPEVFMGELDKQDARADLYSVGIMIYALTVGHLPFSGTVTEITVKKATKPIPVEDIEDSHLRNVVKNSTDVEPSKRYGSAQQFHDDLVNADSPNSQGKWIAIAIVATLAVGAVIAAAVML